MSGSLIGSAEKFAKGGGVDSKEIKKRLEEIRKELRAEKISYGELAELQSLKKYIDPSDVELLEAAGVPEKHEDGGGVAEGWTDAEMLETGGGIAKSSSQGIYWANKIAGEKKNIWSDKVVKVEEHKNHKGRVDSYHIIIDGKAMRKFENAEDAKAFAISFDSEIKRLNAQKHEDGGGVAEGWTDAELMAKGGGVKQKGTSVSSLDKLEKAKRVGYRFTDKKAKQLHLGANAKPTAEEIKKMKNGKGVYYENRKNRSDKSRMKKLEDGGVAEGWTDAELMAKGGKLDGTVVYNKSWNAWFTIKGGKLYSKTDYAYTGTKPLSFYSDVKWELVNQENSPLLMKEKGENGIDGIKADIKRMLEGGGGVAEGWTDAELLEKGGAAKAKKKGGGNSGMMAKIQSGAKALRAEHPSMKWTDCIKKSAANLKAKGELHN
jgi:hypothetical protein